MRQPMISLTPARPAVRAEFPVTLDVLVTITPPVPEPRSARPPLNLALVLDRSGSMGERNKMTFARAAATFAVRELVPTDRLSVIAFDDRVEVPFPNSTVTDKDAVARLIAEIGPRGSTALYGGWQEGVRQAAANPAPGGVNRVVLLSDGLANVGESRPDVIATDVHKAAGSGVGTTTIGVGDEYNEDLLEAMARSGDGSYYYVESPAQLPTIFEAELHGLSATSGVNVTLALEPAAGVTIAEVLNDLDQTPDGSWKLPTLVAGSPVRIVIRLNVGAGSGERPLCGLRLEWTPPKESTRQSESANLTLPGVPTAVWEGLAESVEVQEQAALLQVAKLKKAATKLADQGDTEGARKLIDQAKALLAAAPATAEIAAEQVALARIEGYIDAGNVRAFSKRAKYENHSRSHSRKCQA